MNFYNISNKEMIMNLLLFSIAYILILNLTGFLLCGIDKSRAKKGCWRISEGTLLLVGLCGGCFGLLLGMSVFRHKTKHIKFKILAPLECILWVAIVIHIVSAFTLDRQIQYLEVSYPSSRVSEALDGYVIAFVTDTHSLTTEELREVVDRIAPALAWSEDITEYGQHFMSGWAKSRDGTDVFVSNGTGYLNVMPRVFARPQVILITLEHI